MEQPSIFKEVKHFEVDYRDLEELIEKEYGAKDISLVAIREWRNDTKVSEYVPDEVADEATFEKLKEQLSKPWNWKTNCWSTREVFADLVFRKKAPEGEWLINVSW